MSTRDPISVEIVLGKRGLSGAFRQVADANAYFTPHFPDVSPIHRAFAPMVNAAAYDVSELAIVTAMQSVVADGPVLVLPVTLAARFQHKCIVYNRERGTVAPKDLVGKRVGVRAYSQTTGAWVRAILEHEFGVDSSQIEWLTQEPPHVRNASEPANVIRDPEGQKLVEMLQDGTVVAAIFGNDLPDEDWVAPVVPDPEAKALEAYARDGIVPVNHLLSVSKAFAARHPEAVREIYRLAVAAHKSLPEAQAQMLPIGIEQMRISLELLLEMSWHQALLPRKLSIEKFFGDAINLLD